MTKEKPQISVIVPVYRVEQYLPRCLDSILAQTFADWECILIDDGSPDGSGAICDEYARKDGRFRVIHQENAGVSAARNAGLDAARGEWIAFVDSDDWVDQDTYRRALDAACKRGAEIVCFNISRVAHNGRVSRIRFTDRGLEKNFVCCTVNMNSLWNKVFKKTLFHSLRFSRTLSVCEDLVVVFKALCLSEKTVYLSDYLYFYRVTPGSATQGFLSERKARDTYHAYLQLDDFLAECGRRQEFRHFLRFRNACGAIYFLTQPHLFSPDEFRRLSNPGNVWTYSFRPDFFIVSLCAQIRFDMVPRIYIRLKTVLQSDKPVFKIIGGGVGSPPEFHFAGHGGIRKVA